MLGLLRAIAKVKLSSHLGFLLVACQPVHSDQEVAITGLIDNRIGLEVIEDNAAHMRMRAKRSSKTCQFDIRRHPLHTLTPKPNKPESKLEEFFRTVVDKHHGC